MTQTTQDITTGCRQVGIYRRVYPLASETFITEQASTLINYRPTFVLCTQRKEIPFPTVTLDRDDPWRMRQALFLLTRSPGLFGRHAALAELDLLHAHFGPDGVYALPLAKALSIPLIVTFHGFDITVRRDWRSPLRSPLFSQLLFHEHQLKRDGAAFIAVSAFVRRKLLDHGYPAGRVHLHYIGVDTEKFVPVPRRGGDRFVLCVGRHTEKKGIDTLIGAFARIARRHPDVRLVQVGSGALTGKLVAQVRRLGLEERVHFLGAQSHATVLDLMQQAEVFALPSQTASDGDSEALGIVFNEASACGVPIVSTLHGGIPEAVLDGETGFLTPERDEHALAKKLDLLLSDPALAQSMGARGRALVCQSFDIRKQAAKLEGIYNSLL